MTSEYVELDRLPVTMRWWALVIRGLAAIAFGILTFAKPSISLLALVILWGAYAIVDGVFSIVLSIRGARIVPGWGWFLAEGLVSIAAGAVTFLWPGITALVLLFVIAAWAVLTGIAEIATAVQLRRHVRGEWRLAASGVLSIVFGVLLAMRPGPGALAVTWLIGVYAVLFGALLVALGFQLHRFAEIPEHPVSPERAPTRA
jgi:uncharacterized membrane protein HdeD (DUF308 family)